jgi:hypothetical protein
MLSALTELELEYFYRPLGDRDEGNILVYNSAYLNPPVFYREGREEQDNPPPMIVLKDEDITGWQTKDHGAQFWDTAVLREQRIKRERWAQHFTDAARRESTWKGLRQGVVSSASQILIAAAIRHAYPLVKFERVLLPCSGWATSVEAACALGAKKIRCLDTNTALNLPYYYMREALQKDGVELLFMNWDVSVEYPSDISEIKFDLLIFGPPYFDIESYHRRGQPPSGLDSGCWKKPLAWFINFLEPAWNLCLSKMTYGVILMDYEDVRDLLKYKWDVSPLQQLLVLAAKHGYKLRPYQKVRDGKPNRILHIFEGPNFGKKPKAQKSIAVVSQDQLVSTKFAEKSPGTGARKIIQFTLDDQNGILMNAQLLDFNVQKTADDIANNVSELVKSFQNPESEKDFQDAVDDTPLSTPVPIFPEPDDGGMPQTFSKGGGRNTSGRRNAQQRDLDAPRHQRTRQLSEEDAKAPRAKGANFGKGKGKGKGGKGRSDRASGRYHPDSRYTSAVDVNSVSHSAQQQEF